MTKRSKRPSQADIGSDFQEKSTISFAYCRMWVDERVDRRFLSKC